MFYATIIGYKHIQPAYLIPKRAKGQQQQPKSCYERVIEEDCPCPCNQITRQPIIAWQSTRAIQGLSSDVKQLLNAIKSYISESQSAIWYHNANCDAMSMFGGRHLHVVTF